MTKTKKQIIRFIGVGTVAALMHGTVLFIGVNQFLLAPAWANVIAFLSAFILSFLGHSWFTFRQNNKYINRNTYLNRLVRWFISSVLGFTLNQGLFILGLAYFGESYYLIIWFMLTAIITLISFLLGKLWAFKL